MQNEAEAQAFFDLLVNGTHSGKEISAITGRTLNDPLPSEGLAGGEIWVHYADGRAETRAQNTYGLNASGIYVFVAENLLEQQLVITRLDVQRNQTAYGGGSKSLLPGSTRWVEAKQILPGLVLPDSVNGGLNVRILAFEHTGGKFEEDVKLLTPTATSSKTSFVVMGVDKDTNTFVQYLTVDSDNPVRADVQTVLDTYAGDNIFWLSYAKVANAATELNPADFHDLRFFANGSDGGSIDVTDGTTTVSPATELDLDPAFFDVTDSGGGSALVTFIGSMTGSIAHQYTGYNTVGASTAVMVGGTAYLKKITLTVAGVLSAIEAYIDHDATTNVQPIAMWLMDDNAGAPGKIIQIAPYLAGQNYYPNTTPRWVGMPVGKYLPAGDYWLAVQRPSDPGSDLRLYYDGSGTDRTLAIGNTWAADVHSYTLTTTANNYSIRASLLTTVSPFNPVQRSTANVSNPPTAAELTSIFGAPSAFPLDAIGIVNDNGANMDEYLCFSDGTKWQYIIATEAV